ncbi:hypothetical protein [Pseudomonas koreensis]|uniref:hypothetical protein n=1 Tax=Pseudomonas koreensis TaxID=198620 RepID=UPI001B32C30F|nr:hypothetical protein [Pseudomonas koreensis]MBP3996710.1 hypothetical protein [Pseudomonas koreensis]
MSDVQRFWCHEASNIFCVRASDFDRVTAERDALQQRLTATDDRNDDLSDLLALASISVDYHAGMKGEDGEHLYDLLARIRAIFKPATPAA